MDETYKTIPYERARAKGPSEAALEKMRRADEINKREFAAAVFTDRCPKCGAAQGRNGYLCGGPSRDCSDTGKLARRWLASGGIVALALVLALPARAQTPAPAIGNCYNNGVCYPSAPPCMAGLYIPAGSPCPPAGAPTPGVPTPTPTPATTQLYCHTTSGLCFAYPSPLGMTCDTTPNHTACDAATPTPTPTPSATPTPTAPPMPAPTITTVNLGLPIPWSYVQGCTIFRGVMWCDAGNPTSGPNQGECIFSVDYTRNPPVFRVWACTGLTLDSWESAWPQVDDAPEFGTGCLRVVWIETHGVPPWGQSRGDVFRYGSVTSMIACPVTGRAGALAVDTPNPTILRDSIAESSAWLWPVGWLHLGGQRQLYAVHSGMGQGTYLTRYFWPQHGGVWMDSAAFQPVTYPMQSISDMGIDADGSLVATEYAGDNATTLTIWRSPDQGRTWRVATTVQALPGGSLFSCYWQKGAGGAVLVPWAMLCNSTPPIGSWANGGWSIVSVAWPGAVMPLYWGKALGAPAVKALAMTLTTAPAGAGPAPINQLDVLKMLGARKP